jgi:hypothetical protein
VVEPQLDSFRKYGLHFHPTDSLFCPLLFPNGQNKNTLRVLCDSVVKNKVHDIIGLTSCTHGKYKLWRKFGAQRADFSGDWSEKFKKKLKTGLTAG